MRVTPTNVRPVVIGFRRPHLLRDCLEALRDAGFKGCDIYIDGPRDEADILSVQASVEVAKRFVRQTQSNLVSHTSNLGSFGSMRFAVSSSLLENEVVLILEDDVLISDQAMRILEKLSEISLPDHVSSIALTNQVPLNHLSNPHHLFRASRFSSSQAWITDSAHWSRLIESFIDWRTWLNLERLQRIVGKRDVSRWTRRFDGEAASPSGQWDYSWLATNWKYDWLTLYPNRNFCVNIGFGDHSSFSHSKPLWYPTKMWEGDLTALQNCYDYDARADLWMATHVHGKGAMMKLKRSLDGFLPTLVPLVRKWKGQ